MKSLKLQDDGFYSNGYLPNDIKVCQVVQQVRTGKYLMNIGHILAKKSTQRSLYLFLHGQPKKTHTHHSIFIDSISNLV